MSSSSTVEAIVEGAARALSSRGVRRLSMSDICTEAGVSRGTLYRYFKSKDEVLEALAQHVLARMAAALDEAVTRQPAPEDRLRVVLTTLAELPLRLPYTAAVVGAEPRFAMDFFCRSMPRFLAMLEPVLEPALRDSPPVVSGLLTVTDLCEIFERLLLSTYLVPTPDAHLLPGLAYELWDSLTQSNQRTTHLAVAALPPAAQVD